jgi:hypothetical protein
MQTVFFQESHPISPFKLNVQIRQQIQYIYLTKLKAMEPKQFFLRSSVSTATRLTVRCPRNWGSIFKVHELSLFPTTARGALALTHTPVKRVPVADSLGVKRSGYEADHSPLSSAEVKYGGSIAHFHIFTAWCLINYADHCGRAV